MYKKVIIFNLMMRGGSFRKEYIAFLKKFMKKSIFKKIMGAVLATTLVFGLVSCGGDKGTSTTKESNRLEEIKKKGVLVLGTSADYPPYEFHGDVNGKDEIVGFDIAIAKEIAKELGVELKINDMKFDGLLAALQSGTVDMVISGMNPTEERQKSVDFSDIYYKAEHGIIIMKKDKDLYENKDSFKGKRIGVQKATVQEGLAREQIEKAEIKGLSKIPDLVMDMRAGNLDAVISELPVAEFNASKNNDLYVIKEAGFKVDELEKGSAIAMPKDSKELVDEVNKILKKLIDDGKIDQFIVDANAMMK